MAHTLYRIVKNDPPTQEDFLSHAELGKVPREPTADLLERWHATSMYSEKRFAQALARQRPNLGRYVATVQIEDGAPFRIRQTGRREHYDVWGDANELLSRVVAIEQAENETVY